ncbi:MAG: iron export ABC transporter permease subunit FetB [Firmicutes bacterium HGW-Firmicutes-14]|nr:MAG: iron export ABC transporter permease subunit FetB [Firmicutes bacterium HGW-Firmicutes-14]
MDSGIVPISGFQLALSVFLVVIAGAVSALLRLGLLKSLAWGTVRTFVQLTFIGYVLKYVFSENRLWLISLIIVLMCFIAARASVSRTPNVPHYPVVPAFWSLLASTVLVGFLVVRVIISPEPWYSARIVIPIFGMILGNSMNGIALSLDRLYGEAKARTGEVEGLLAFGATPWEAIRGCVREAVRAGMTPIINSLMVVGVVSLPGMMTGQILGGADPHEAVRYQIVVMLMIAAAVAIGCLLLVGFSYKKLFTPEGALKDEIFHSRRQGS